MNIELEIMLEQCEELATALIALPMGDEFLEMLDRFTNSFDQLTQILENNTDKTSVNTATLSSMMDIITEKISTEKNRLENETKIAANKKNNLPFYGTARMIAPKKFDTMS